MNTYRRELKTDKGRKKKAFKGLAIALSVLIFLAMVPISAWAKEAEVSDQTDSAGTAVQDDTIGTAAQDDAVVPGSEEDVQPDGTAAENPPSVPLPVTDGAAEDSAPVFTVIFMGAESELDRQQVTAGAEATPPAAENVSPPEGMEFIGWDTDAWQNVQSDVTITALFAAPPSNDTPVDLPQAAQVNLRLWTKDGAEIADNSEWDYAHEPIAYNTQVVLGESAPSEAAHVIKIWAPFGMIFSSLPQPPDSIESIKATSEAVEINGNYVMRHGVIVTRKAGMQDNSCSWTMHTESHGTQYGNQSAGYAVGGILVQAQAMVNGVTEADYYIDNELKSNVQHRRTLKEYPTGNFLRNLYEPTNSVTSNGEVPTIRFRAQGGKDGGTFGLHNPFWNATIKVYLPKEITAQGSGVFVDEDGDRYILLNLSERGDWRHLASPLLYEKANVNYTYYQLRFSGAPQPNTTYQSNKKTEFTYTILENGAPVTKTDYLDAPKYVTDSFKYVDKWAVPTYTSLAFLQGVNTKPLANNGNNLEMVDLSGDDANDKHINGTLELKMGEHYTLSELDIRYGVGWDAVYYLKGDDTAYPALRNGSNYTFPMLTEDNYLDRLVFQLGDKGISGSTTLYPGVRADKDIEPNTNKGPWYESSMTMTLRGENGCDTSLHPPGEHSRTFPVRLYPLAEGLVTLVQPTGGPFLNNTEGSEKSIRVDFTTPLGSNQGIGLTHYTYSEIEVDFGYDDASKDLLSTINKVDIPSYDAAANPRWLYATNKHPEVREIATSFDASLLEADEYFTSLVFRIDSFTLKQPPQFVFYSKLRRNFTYAGEENQGARIPDRREKDASIAPFNVRVNYQNMEGERKSVEGAFAEGKTANFTRWREEPLRLEGNSQYYDAPHTSFYNKVAQGDTFIASVTAYFYNHQAPVRNGELWLRINPDFAYAGTDDNIRTVTASDGNHYLILTEAPEVTGQVTYRILMRVLPSASTGGGKSPFDAGWRVYTDTCDESYKENPPYVYITPPASANQQFFDADGDVLDINGNGLVGPQEILAKIGISANLEVMLKVTNGVNLYPGSGGSMVENSGIPLSIYPHEANQLSLYTSIGNTKTDLDNHETVLHLPQKGEAAPDSKGQAGFGLQLTGPVRVHSSSISHTVKYKIGGNLYSENDVDGHGGWQAVTDVVVAIPKLKSNEALGFFLDVQSTEDTDKLPTGTNGYIGCFYRYENGSNTVENLQATPGMYSIKGYTIAGNVFGDIDGSNLRDGNEPGMGGLTVELYKKDGKEPLNQTTTSPNGTYAFSNMAPGEYTVRVGLPQGEYSSCYYFAEKHLGGAANGSHVDARGYTDSIDVTAAPHSVFNSGIQARGLLRVEFREDAVDGVQLGKTIETELSHTATGTVAPDAAESYALPEGYSIKDETPATLNYTLTWDAPMATLIFVVTRDEQPMPMTFTLLYKGNGHTADDLPPAADYPAGEVVSVAAGPARDSSTFTGWLASHDGAVYTEGQALTMPAENVTLTALWQGDATYTIHHYRAGTRDSVAPSEYGTGPVGQQVNAAAVILPGLQADASIKGLTLDADNNKNVLTFEYTENSTDPVAPVTPVLPPDIGAPDSESPDSESPDGGTSDRGLPTEETLGTDPAIPGADPRLAEQTGNLIEDLGNNAVPLSNFSGGAWSLLSLMVAITSLCATIVMLLRSFIKRRVRSEEVEAKADADVYNRQEGQSKQSRWTLARTISMLLGLLPGFLFLLLDDISMPVAFVNQNTPWVLLGLVVFLAAAGLQLFFKRRSRQGDNEEDTMAEA